MRSTQVVRKFTTNDEWRHDQLISATSVYFTNQQVTLTSDEAM